jgi:hypothetical protein
MKVAGINFKKFWNEAWEGVDAYLEEESYIVNKTEVDEIDVDAIKDYESIEILSGYLVFDDTDKDGNYRTKSLKIFYRDWEKKQNEECIIVKFKRADSERIIAEIKKIQGVKI